MSDSIDKGNWAELLKAVEFFKPFDAADLDEMFESSVVTKYPSGATIIIESGLEDSFYVILSGEARVVKEDNNKLRTISTLATGDCFGEMAMLLDEPRSASILAETNCIVFEIEKDEIDKLRIEIREKLYRQFAIMISRRLKYSHRSK